jgi:hypothetical protein
VKRKVKEGGREKEVEVVVGRKLEWDAKNLKATNCPEADRFIHKQYRSGWILNG